MKKVCLLIILFALAISVFGQQVLWTTDRGGEAQRFVSLGNVTKEVLAFYNQYNYYYDFTGFDKNTFIYTFGNDWDWVYSVNSKVVLAMRINIEGGSAVYVIHIDRHGVNMIAFTNVYDTESGVAATGTSSGRKAQFERWLNAVLN